METTKMFSDFIYTQARYVNVQTEPVARIPTFMPHREVHPMKTDCLMTIPELMDFLQVKRNTIYTLRRLGLPTVKIGRSVRFRADSILKWLTDMEQRHPDSMSPLLKPESSHLL